MHETTSTREQAGGLLGTPPSPQMGTQRPRRRLLGAATFPLSPSGLRQQLAPPHAAPARARGERQESAACLAKFPNAICKRLQGHGQARA